MKSTADGTRSTLLAVVGLALGILGVAGYFVVVMRLGAWLPGVRNYAVPNWIAVALGLVLSVVALRRARRRLLPAILLGANAVVAAFFVSLLYFVTAVEPVTGPPIGSPAPAFALADQTGKTVRLEDFHGGPLLLVFYRGHW